MKSHLSIALAISLTTALAGQPSQQGKPNVNQDPYPLGNPVVRHMYTADAAPRVMPDGRVWMVTSVDSEAGGGYETMHAYHTFSSADMVNWIDHGQVLHVDEIRPADAPKADKYALWAPDMIYRHGKYYLYYPVRILHSDKQRPDGGRVVTSYLGVAVSEDPSEPFTVVNPRIEGAQGIDPSVFIDDDGEAYLYWGQMQAARLAPNMIELATTPKKLDFDTDRFMEAIWMHKRDGKYYVNYHTKYDWQIKITSENAADPERKKSELAYSVGQSPLGPFEYGGTLNYELGVNVKGGPVSPEGDFVPWRLTQSNHGGVVEYHGNEYLFYHTSALSSWRQDSFKAEGTWTQRSVSIDQLHYHLDGSVVPVQQTVWGPAPVAVSQPFQIALNRPTSGDANVGPEDSWSVKGADAIVSFENIDFGTGYYYLELQAFGSDQPGTIELRLGEPDGNLIGTLLINQGPSSNDEYISSFLREANGPNDLHMIFRGPASEEGIVIKRARAFGGSPLTR